MQGLIREFSLFAVEVIWISRQNIGGELRVNFNNIVCMLLNYH